MWNYAFVFCGNEIILREWKTRREENRLVEELGPNNMKTFHNIREAQVFIRKMKRN